LKKILYILFAIVFCGCDVIHEQDRILTLQLDSIPLSVDSPPDTQDTIQEDIVLRTNVLIEFTGFRCVNCPTAAVRAQELGHLYGDRLIVVAMHPASNPFTKGAAKYNYTCPEADIYYQFMGGTAQTSFPTGNINMQKLSGGYFCDYMDWPGIIADAMRDTAEVHMEIIGLQADTVTREVSFNLTAFTDRTIDCNMVFWIVEDSIKGAQAMPDGTNNMEYYHRHVLRRTISTDPWGEAIQLTKEKLTISKSTTLPEEYDILQCHIIAVALDPNDKHILNAAEASIKIIQQ